MLTCKVWVSCVFSVIKKKSSSLDNAYFSEAILKQIFCSHVFGGMKDGYKNGRAKLFCQNEQGKMTTEYHLRGLTVAVPFKLLAQEQWISQPVVERSRLWPICRKILAYSLWMNFFSSCKQYLRVMMFQSLKWRKEWYWVPKRILIFYKYYLCFR